MPSSIRSISDVLIRRFRTDERANAAVQFALIGPLFFALLFAIIDAALIFFAGQSLEAVTQNAARMILTGQAQLNSYSQAQFKSAICSQVVALFNCSTGIYVDVKSYSSASSVTMTQPIDVNGNFTTVGFTYSPGNPGDIVVVRVFYQWPIFVPTLGFNPSNLTGNMYLLTATAAFVNEPYSS